MGNGREISLEGDWGRDGRQLVEVDAVGWPLPANSSPSAFEEANIELAAASIEAAVSSPDHLNMSLEALPESLRAKMAETMSIPPMKGRAKAAESALMSRL